METGQSRYGDSDALAVGAARWDDDMPPFHSRSESAELHRHSFGDWLERFKRVSGSSGLKVQAAIAW